MLQMKLISFKVSFSLVSLFNKIPLVEKTFTYLHVFSPQTKYGENGTALTRGK